MSRYKSLRAWLAATHTTQAKLAQELGVSSAMISSIVRGVQEPGYRLALRIQNRTGLPLSLLKKPERPKPESSQPESVA